MVLPDLDYRSKVLLGSSRVVLVSSPAVYLKLLCTTKSPWSIPNWILQFLMLSFLSRLFLKAVLAYQPLT